MSGVLERWTDLRDMPVGPPALDVDTDGSRQTPPITIIKHPWAATVADHKDTGSHWTALKERFLGTH